MNIYSNHRLLKARFKSLALTCFKSTLRLVNHINAALAPDNATVFMPFFQGFKRWFNFHSRRSWFVFWLFTQSVGWV